MDGRVYTRSRGADRRPPRLAAPAVVDPTCRGGDAPAAVAALPEVVLAAVAARGPPRMGTSSRPSRHLFLWRQVSLLPVRLQGDEAYEEARFRSSGPPRPHSVRAAHGSDAGGGCAFREPRGCPGSRRRTVSGDLVGRADPGSERLGARSFVHDRLHQHRVPDGPTLLQSLRQPARRWQQLQGLRDAGPGPLPDRRLGKG